MIESLELFRNRTNVTVEDIEQLSYVQILALLSESNRPPGGNKAISEYIAHLGLTNTSRVLHAGCNAGFLTREMHRRSGASVVGIDISPEMVQAANERSLKERLYPHVSHLHDDMRKMSFADEYFDACFSGGALAFVDDHSSAVDEWVRVTKPGSMLGEIALYYSQQPPHGVIEAVEEIIHVKIPQYSSRYWVDLFHTHQRIEPYYVKEIETGEKSAEEVDQYCEDIIEYSLPMWNTEAKEFLLERISSVFQIFNENMKYLDAVVVLSKTKHTNAEPSLYA